MSVNSRDTNINQTDYWFLTANARVFNTSTLNANTISTNTLTANSTIANQLSTILLDANDINASTVFAYEVFIDNQGLTATPTELLLNGVPIATTANLSSIQDWAAFPATSTINAAGNNLISTNNVTAANITATNGMFQNLMVQNVFAVSTYTSTISSLAEVADVGFIGTLSTGATSAGNLTTSTFGLGTNLPGVAGGGYQMEVAAPSTNSVGVVQRISTAASTAALYQQFGEHGYNTYWEKLNILQSGINLSDNGVAISDNKDGGTDFLVSSNNTYVLGDLSVANDLETGTLWGQPSSFYQNAVSSISSFNPVNIVCSTLTAADYVSTPTAVLSSLKGTPDVTILADSGAAVNVPEIALIAQNGTGGSIKLTADTGVGGTSYGAITLTANGGTTDGIGTGGSINIVANTPIGTLSNASSKVTINAAGVNVYAGAVPAIGSLTGYLFQFGNLGINQCVGLPSVVPNFPGTLYQYATGGVGYGGIRMESPAGVELVDNTDLYAYRIYPYYNTFLVGTHPDMTVTGRSNVVGNNQYLNLSSVKGLEFGFNETKGYINGLSSINGQPLSYYTPQPVVSSFQTLATSTLNTTQGELTGISSINGQPLSFYEPGGVSTVSTFDKLFASSLTTSSILDAASSISIVCSGGSDMLFDDSGSVTTNASRYLIGNTANGLGGTATYTLSGNGLTQLTATNSITTQSEVFQTLAYTGADNTSLVINQGVSTISVTAEAGINLATATYGATGNDFINLNTTSTLIEKGVLQLGQSTLVKRNPDFAQIEFYNAQNLSTSQVLAGVYGLQSYSGDPNLGFYTRLTDNRPAYINSNFSTNRLAYVTDSNLNISTLNVSTLTVSGISTATFSSSTAVGGQGQPAGRLILDGCDLDLRQNDLWVQQIKVGAGNATNAQSEIIFYDAAAGVKGLNTALQDRTIRVVSTINGTTGGYLLDTNINPPFFSTINAGTSTALFAYFPSSVNSTIGVSTLSVIPNPIFAAAANSLSSQKVLAANTPLAIDLGSLGINVGGYTVQRSTITVPVAGTYQFSPSLQFQTTSGGQNTVDFWLTKNGADIPNSASRCSVANNAENIGTVVLYDTAAAGDQYGIKIASADANMTAGFFQSTVTSPYTRPAIPSLILNAQRVA